MSPGALREEREIVNAGLRRIRLEVMLTAGTDLARMTDVKAGRCLAALPARAQDGGGPS